MRKYIFSITLVLYLTTISKGQNWAPVGAKWYFNVTGGSPRELIIVESTGDTVINNKQCSILLTSEINKNSNDGVTYFWDTLNCPSQYTYYDSGKVYLYDSVKYNFDLLYDFNAVNGDTLTCRDSAFNGYCPYGGDSNLLLQYFVNNTNDTIISGITLHRQYITTTADANWSFDNNFPIIERIGSTYFLFGHSVINGFEGEPNGLRCYQDGILSYRSTSWADSIPCNYLPPLSAREVLGATSIIQLSPNPATNQLTIKTPYINYDKQVTVSIMNVLGQRAAPTISLSKIGESAVIDVGALPAGMYFLQLKTESGCEVKRFVKE